MVDKKGRFFVIEGTDGTGKATQIKLLDERLRGEGYRTEVFDFPQYGKNAFADTVADYLGNKFGDAVSVNPYLASVLYAADRWKASPFIRSAIGAGRIVLANRYSSANMGHQGSKFDDLEQRREFLKWLDELEFSERGFNIPRPDLTILLYLDPKIAQELVDRKSAEQRVYTNGKKRDGHEGNLEHLRKTRDAFLQIGKENGWELINCEDLVSHQILPPAVIQYSIFERVCSYLPQMQNP